MGTSAREIERQIKETRERMDDNLTRLEDQASSGARRYGRIAAIVLGVVAIGGVAYVIYRRTRRRTLRDRLDSVSIENLGTYLAEVSERLKEQLPSVTVHVNEKADDDPGMVQSILRSVVPALVGTAGTAILERVARPRGEVYAAPQAE